MADVLATEAASCLQDHLSLPKWLSTPGSEEFRSIWKQVVHYSASCGRLRMGRLTLHLIGPGIYFQITLDFAFSFRFQESADPRLSELRRSRESRFQYIAKNLVPRNPVLAYKTRLEAFPKGLPRIWRNTATLSLGRVVFRPFFNELTQSFAGKIRTVLQKRQYQEFRISGSCIYPMDWRLSRKISWQNIKMLYFGNAITFG